MNRSPKDPYELSITPEGLRHLDRLPSKIREAALAALHGRIRENPQRLGKELVGDLAGLFSAQRGDYRIIYSIDNKDRVVVVHRVQHQSSVYRGR